MSAWKSYEPPPPSPDEQGVFPAPGEWGWSMVSFRPQSTLAAGPAVAADTTTLTVDTTVDTTTVTAANIVPDAASARELELQDEVFHWHTIARLAQAEVFEARTVRTTRCSLTMETPNNEP
ncbi:hypothetical protein H072_26 [Dactylellina haptotyla CBS 200.50]|uniref:Uncharacterized protein n=1 Tax=Dactylellina haptotyla (strain CBS 200.50) TaxID=1284197 RepID=S8ASY3_DACHA|nr:hypothetical protein H072_26 [Dactylellina haptotyla CBS 200.50]